MNSKQNRLAQRKNRIRAVVSGTAERPRISVYSSNKNIFIQAIDDANGVTLASAGTLSEAGKKAASVETAKVVAATLGGKLAEKKIKEVVFDRNGKKYHGKVKAVAETLREKGISF